MKTRFHYALMKAMIESRDFLVVRDGEGDLNVNDYNNILSKDSYGNNTLIEIFDGDRFTTEEISARLKRNGQILSELKAVNTQYILEVFIFESEPEKEIQEVLRSGELHDLEGKKYLKCISVDLKAGQIKKHFESVITDMGLVKTMKKLINSSISKETGIDEIKALVLKKEKEFEFELKAKTPVFTYALITINIIVAALYYLYSTKSGISYEQLLYDYGAKVNSKILTGEYFRFITPIFLHAGVTHLVLNCYSLYAVGVSVEKIFGRFKFLFIYMIAGILGNVASFMFSPNWGIGASGAIFGLMGALLYFGLERPALFKRFFGYNILVIIIINLTYGFSTTGIDNFAHIGGLLGGFLATGIIVNSGRSRWYFNRVLYLVLTIIITASGIAYAFNSNESKIIIKANALDKYNKASDWRNAEITAKQILGLKPSDNNTKEAVLSVLVKAEALSGKYDEAVSYAKMVTPIDPGYGHYLLGVLYHDMKKYDLSREELLAAKKAGATYEQIDKLLNERK
jgi:rhomboid protease GluP